MEEQERHGRLITHINVSNPFMVKNNIRIIRLEKDRAVAELLVGEDSLNQLGFVHGGAYFTLGDCVCSILAREGGIQHVTLDGDMHFIRNVKGGTVTAVATLLHRGRSTCLAEVAMTDEGGKLLATGRFTLFSKGVAAPGLEEE